MIITEFSELEKVGAGRGVTLSTIPGFLYIKRATGLWSDVIMLQGEAIQTVGSEVTDTEIWDYSVLRSSTISLLFGPGYSAMPNDFISLLHGQTEIVNRILEYFIEKKKEFGGMDMPAYIEAQTVIDILAEVYAKYGKPDFS
jgi:hypothetical protein